MEGKEGVEGVSEKVTVKSRTTTKYIRSLEGREGEKGGRGGCEYQRITRL